MTKIDVTDEKIVQAIENLISLVGAEGESIEADLVTQQIQTSLRFLSEGHNIGQLKLVTNALKELRYAYRIFNEYPKSHRISIFGSARTPEDHPDYKAAEAFSRAITEHGWIVITGAANGIMKAGMAGAASGSSFGLSIRLPFEVPSNNYIEGDPKHIFFKYFFTRKLMFMSHSNAVAVFPGGVGTLDELFEMLTLVQTGKNAIVPIVLLEGPGGVYWKHWETYVKKNLLENGWICQADRNLYHIALDVDDAVAHIEKFYRRYHSNRYVKEQLVIRMTEKLNDSQMLVLNSEFSSLCASGRIVQCEAYPEEGEYLDLPRLSFHHTRKDFGMVRGLIDRINEF